MPTPQDLLDDLHSIRFQDAWDTTISKKERAALIKAKRAQLKTAKQLLRQEQDAIKKRYDGRNKQEAAIEQQKLLPYSLIDHLIAKLENCLNDVQNANEFDRPIVESPVFGQIFYGGLLYGGYQIATAANLKQIQQEQLERGKVIKAQIKSLKDKQETLQASQPDETFIKSTFSSRNAQVMFRGFLLWVAAFEILGLSVYINSGELVKILGAATFATVILTFVIQASIQRLNRKYLHPYIATLTNIKLLDVEIAQAEALYNQVKGFYDEAKDGLKRIAQTSQMQ